MSSLAADALANASADSELAESFLDAGDTATTERFGWPPTPLISNPEPGRISRIASAMAQLIWWMFCLSSLVVMLAILTAIPVVQLVSLGYLLTVAGRLAGGGSLRRSLPGLQTAGRIGLALSMLTAASWVTGLLAHWQSVAAIIEPNSQTADQLEFAAFTMSLLATAWLGWAWIRGGRLKHYLWPQPKRFFAEVWRWETWARASEAFSKLVASLRLPSLFWLGLRGLACTLVWLIPAMIIMGVTRNGQNGAAGLLGAVSLIALAAAMLYVPMLQASFAAANDWRAMFRWREIRRDFRYAPWSWAGGMLVGLVLMPIPLYLLKIEATPAEITWLPCLVFVAFMLPARIAEGLALRRCRRLRAIAEADPVAYHQRPTTWLGRLTRLWRGPSRWIVRLIVMPAIVTAYMLVLSASQFTSWNGIETWIAQHALLVPVPFVGV